MFVPLQRYQFFTDLADCRQQKREKTVQILAAPMVVSSSETRQSRSSSAEAREDSPDLGRSDQPFRSVPCQQVLLHTVLAVSNCVGHDGTCYAVLKMLRWNFDVERVDVRLGHNVQYTGQCQGCPFWCQSAQKEATWRGGTPNRTEIWLFQGVKVDEMD